jgi:NADPH:quinone reductase-like Zn-dependent oxidoreductase
MQRLDRFGLVSGLGGETQGCLAEYHAFPELGVVSMPDHLSFVEASTLPCAALTVRGFLV